MYVYIYMQHEMELDFFKGNVRAVQWVFTSSVDW